MNPPGTEPAPDLNTERLHLRPFRPDDADRVTELLQEPEIARTTLSIPYPYERAMAEQWIATIEQAGVTGTGTVFAVCLREGPLIGSMGIHLSLRHFRGEAGYWIGKPYWNHGYATEALRALIRFAFTRLNLHKVTSNHFAGNEASGRVMQKAGMTREGICPDQIAKGGEFHTIVLYGILNPAQQP